MAPARCRRETISASAVATFSFKNGVPPVSRTPATSQLSFSATGTPWSGPTASPVVTARSTSLAAASAASRHDGEVGIQSRVERLDAVEAGLNEFYRRELAGPNQADNISNAQPREISDGHMEQPALSSLNLGVDEGDDSLKGLFGGW